MRGVRYNNFSRVLLRIVLSFFLLSTFVFGASNPYGDTNSKISNSNRLVKQLSDKAQKANASGTLTQNITPSTMANDSTNTATSGSSLILKPSSTTSTIDVGTTPVADVSVTVGGIPYVYVGNSGSQFVSVINAVTNKVVTSIPLSSGTYAREILPYVIGGVTYLYFPTYAGLAVIDTSSNTVVTVLATPYAASSVEVDVLGGVPYMYVVSASNLHVYVTVVNANTNTVVLSGMEMVGSQYATSIVIANHYLYVADYYNDNVRVMDTTTYSMGTVYAQYAEYMAKITVSGHDYVYATGRSYNLVTIIDTVTNTSSTIGPFSPSYSPNHLIPAYIGGVPYVYVTLATGYIGVINATTQSISVLSVPGLAANTGSYSLASFVTIGSTPYMYLKGTQHNVYVFDISSNTLVANIGTPTGVGGITSAVVDGVSYVYITDNDPFNNYNVDAKVSVIDTRTNTIMSFPSSPYLTPGTGKTSITPSAGGVLNHWSNPQVTTTLPSGTSVSMTYSVDDSTYVTDITTLPLSATLYVQATLATSNTAVTPSLDTLSIDYTPIAVTLTAPPSPHTYLFGSGTGAVSSVPVAWSVTDTYGTSYIKTSYSLNGGSSWSVISGSLASGSVTDTLTPPGNTNTTTAQVKVEYFNASNVLIASASSGNFTIITNASPTATPTSPADSATVASGSTTFTATIADTDYNNSVVADTVTADWRLCSDSACTTVVDSVSNTSINITSGGVGTLSLSRTISTGGTYYWQVMATDSHGATSAWSTSRLLTVTSPITVNITSPIDGNTYLIGAGTGATTTIPVTWTASNIIGVDHITTSYSLNSGSTWTTISASLAPGTTSDTLTPPTNTSVTTAQVKVEYFNGTPSLMASDTTANFTIITNHAPTATLTSPSNSAAFTSGDTPTFTASIGDIDYNNAVVSDTVTASWQLCTTSNCSLVSQSVSSQAVSITSGGTGTFSHASSALSAGTYYWRVNVTDSHGATPGYTATRTITVTDPNHTPTISLTSPADGTSYTTGDAPTFTASVGDTDSGDSVTVDWQLCTDSGCSSVSQSVAGQSVTLSSGTGTFSHTASAISTSGTYYWRANVTDSHGATPGYTSTRTISVTDPTPVVPPTPTPPTPVVPSTNHTPTISLTAPDNGATITPSDTPTFTASVSDSDLTDTVTVNWQLCNDTGCSSVVSALTNQAVPLTSGTGTFSHTGSSLSVGTYYWRASVKDNHAASSGYTTTRTLNVVTANQPPSVTNLGPSEVVDGGEITNHSPHFSFTTSDPDLGDTVSYQIRILNSAGITVVEYLSSSSNPGDKLFSVGQATGDGTYSAGYPSQTLPDGPYYWSVQALDNHTNQSGFALAASGNIAFVITTPDNPGPGGGDPTPNCPICGVPFIGPIIDPIIGSVTSTNATNATSVALVALSLPGILSTIGSNIASGLPFLSINWYALLGFVPKKKRKQWGIVLSKLTNLPIAGVFVELLTTEGTLITKSLTDKTGQFGFLIDQPGTFKLRISNPLYQLFESYPITITDPTSEIVKQDIMLEPLPGMMRQQMKRSAALIKTLQYLSYLHYPISILGTIFSIFALMHTQNFWNFFVLFFYLIIWAYDIYLAFHQVRAYGKVLDQVTKQPLPLSVVQLTSTNKGRGAGSEGAAEIIRSTITDSKGRFIFVVGKNSYDITAAHEGYAPQERQVTTDNINEDILLGAEN